MEEKKVNGKTVILSTEDEAAIKEEWATGLVETQKKSLVDAKDTALREVKINVPTKGNVWANKGDLQNISRLISDMEHQGATEAELEQGDKFIILTLAELKSVRKKGYRREQEIRDQYREAVKAILND